MALTIGIVGLPNVGESTLFNALIRTAALAASYPFVAIEPNMGVMPLPNARLDEFTELFHSARAVPATVSFMDIVGIARGTSEGERLDNQFPAGTREADAICMVTRIFENPDVVCVDEKVEPVGDIEVISAELVLMDIQILEKAIPRLEKEVQGKRAEPVVLEMVQVALRVLEEGTLLSTGTEAARAGAEMLRAFQLMTIKPFTYVFNMGDAGTSNEVCRAELRELAAPAEAVFLDVQFEAELVELELEGTAEMLHDNGQEESGSDKLARVRFDTLGPQTHLTAGEEESHAWTICRGVMAPQAAGVIHADFERGFIKAEVVNCDDLVQYDSAAETRVHGRMRMEGKGYVMTSGNVVEFRFGV